MRIELDDAEREILRRYIALKPLSEERSYILAYGVPKLIESLLAAR